MIFPIFRLGEGRCIPLWDAPPLRVADGIMLYSGESLVAGLFAAWRKRYWNRLRNCQRILSEKAESTENVDKVVQAVPSHVVQ